MELENTIFIDQADQDDNSADLTVLTGVFDKYPTSGGLREAVKTLLEKQKQTNNLVLSGGDLFSIRANKIRF